MTFTKFATATLCFTLFACNQTSNPSDSLKKIDTPKNASANSAPITTQKKDSLNAPKVEENIIDTILKLSEVKNRAKYIEEQTNGKRNLKVWIQNTPHLPDQKFYWIKVGEDNGSNLVTHFNFYVYPDSMRIMYYDIENDKEITLPEWRK